MKRKLKYIITIIGMVSIYLVLAIPVLAYDGQGGLYSESTIGSSGTNNSYLVINTGTTTNTFMDIRSSSGFSSGINQSTQLARDLLPLLALVSILIIMSGVLMRLTDGGILEIIGTESPIFIILIIAIVLIMASAFIAPLVNSVNALP